MSENTNRYADLLDEGRHVGALIDKVIAEAALSEIKRYDATVASVIVALFNAIITGDTYALSLVKRAAKEHKSYKITKKLVSDEDYLKHFQNKAAHRETYTSLSSDAIYDLIMERESDEKTD